jgi:hypothetical protein
MHAENSATPVPAPQGGTLSQYVGAASTAHDT